MPAKRDPILVALGACPKKWSQFLLKNYGLPEEPQSRNVVSEAELFDKDRSRASLDDFAARQIRLGEEPPKGLLKVWAEHSGPESEASEQWRRSQAFMRVMAWIFARENKLGQNERAALLKNIDDLRPETSLPVFPEVLGSPDEFFERWKGYEFDVRFSRKSRRTQVFEIRQYRLPPDEPEELDEADEPKGHWEGLKWIPDPRQN